MLLQDQGLIIFYGQKLFLFSFQWSKRAMTFNGNLITPGPQEMIAKQKKTKKEEKMTVNQEEILYRFSLAA